MHIIGQAADPAGCLWLQTGLFTPKSEYVTILPSSVNERALLRSRCLVSMPARVFVFFGTLAYLSG